MRINVLVTGLCAGQNSSVHNGADGGLADGGVHVDGRHRGNLRFGCTRPAGMNPSGVLVPARLLTKWEVSGPFLEAGVASRLQQPRSECRSLQSAGGRTHRFIELIFL